MQGRIVSGLITINDSSSPLGVLKTCGGYYQGPRGSGGEFLGPLVAFAGTYAEGPAAEKKHFVGPDYFNLAMAEQYPHVLRWYAGLLATMVRNQLPSLDGVIGMPLGGMLFSGALGLELDRLVIFPEKKVTTVATSGSREESQLVFSRHTVQKDWNYVLVEDVCNNFSTTNKAIALVKTAGGRVVGIVCIINRSPQTDFEGLPVISVVHIPSEQYQQGDPMVVGLVRAGKVIWKPKESWPELAAAMEAARTT